MISYRLPYVFTNLDYQASHMLKEHHHHKLFAFLIAWAMNDILMECANLAKEFEGLHDLKAVANLVDGKTLYIIDHRYYGEYVWYTKVLL